MLVSQKQWSDEVGVVIQFLVVYKSIVYMQLQNCKLLIVFQSLTQSKQTIEIARTRSDRRRWLALIQSTEEIVKLQQKLTQQQVQAQKENEMLVKRIMQVKEQNIQLQTKIQQIESGKKPKKDNAAIEPNNTKDIEELIQQSNISKRYIEQLESQLYSSKNDLKKQIDTREQLLQTNLQLVNNNQNEMKQCKVEITELKNKLSVLNQQLSQYQKEAQYKTEKLVNEKIQIFVAKDIKLDIEQLLIKQQETNQIVEVQIQQINSLQLFVQQLKQQLFITSIQELANSSQNVEEYKLISVNQ
ncbi:Hypothetical_protein [Hexamita inflata]|uniref:Hypothetical_protein n=1 Tax=Hexamita inflata TaxID=28002 RepID=A0ABP1IKJ2_9EUKA